MNYLSINYLLLAIIIFSSKYISGNNKQTVIYKCAIFIGIAQSIAILPGFSRSGLTIMMAMYLGLSFKTATKFSFLLAIPILLFASFDSIYQYLSSEYLSSTFKSSILLGFIVSFITGYLSLNFLQNIVGSKKFWYFSIYCFITSLVLFNGI